MFKALMNTHEQFQWEYVVCIFISVTGYGFKKFELSLPRFTHQLIRSLLVI